MEHLTSSTSRTVEFNPPGIITKLFSLFILIIFLVLALLIAVPLLLIALVIGAVAFLYFKLKRTLSKAKSPNGPLDGRHNVKVVNQDQYKE